MLPEITWIHIYLCYAIGAIDLDVMKYTFPKNGYTVFLERISFFIVKQSSSVRHEEAGFVADVFDKTATINPFDIR